MARCEFFVRRNPRGLGDSVDPEYCQLILNDVCGRERWRDQTCQGIGLFPMLGDRNEPKPGDYPKDLCPVILFYEGAQDGLSLKQAQADLYKLRWPS